jgi:pimeloyl-ACP methyl ester carboxylesterase
MPFHQVPTCTLHYRDEGAGGPPIVFLHGWCDDATIWDEVVPSFSTSHRCLVPEMRGHGQSGMPLDHALFPEALSNDVVAICAAAGVERPVLVGHSYGGYLAAEVVRRFPGFARAVVVEDQALALDALQAQLQPIESLIRSAETHLAFREQLKGSLIPEGTSPDVVARVMATGLTTPVDVALGLWAALFEYSADELRERGESLIRALAAQPALVISRAEDPEYDTMVRRLAPNAELEAMPGSHWIHLEHLAAFVDRVRQFIATLD